MVCFSLLLMHDVVIEHLQELVDGEDVVVESLVLIAMPDVVLTVVKRKEGLVGMVSFVLNVTNDLEL